MLRTLRWLVSGGSLMLISFRCGVVRGLARRGVRQAATKEFCREPDNLVTLLVDRGKGVNSQVGQGLVWTESFYWKMIFLGQH